MDIKEKLKEGFEESVKRAENFIGNKGLGSSRLKKARQKQLNINIALFVTGILSLTGVALWALGRNRSH